MEPQTSTQPRISDYLRPLTARWWLIVVAVVAATGGVYAYYRHKPNVYSTATLIYYHDPGDPVTGVPSPQSTDRSVANEATLLYSRDTAKAVAITIGFHGSPDDLLSHVSLTSKPGVDFVQISVQAGNPRLAATIANGFAQQLVSQLNGNVQLRVADALALSRAQLSQLPKGPASSVQVANLLDQINRLDLAQRVPSTVASQVEPASVPSGPSAPKPVRNALFALLISLFAAIALAYGLARFDRRLKSPEDMEDAYGRALLAVLPHTPDPAPVREDGAAFGASFREPFRLLRTNLELASLDDPPRTIVVSSAMPGEGKSTVARNLALAFCETGKRVLLIDLDLRHPALAPMFGVGFGPGMTDVLRHGVEVDDALLPTPVALPRLDQVLQLSAAGRPAGDRANSSNGQGVYDSEITLLLSGGRPANPPAVLASERLVEVLDSLRERYDVVLIDSAPVLAVTDTVPLLRYADAAVFVGRLGVTTRDTAKRLREFLARVPDVNLLGIVANDMSRHDAGSYGYGYGYGPYHGDESESTSGRRGLRRRRKAAAETL
jgi:Mrp family chromosome partitioning ATPase/capsular polysaccharide biosynthesis protein